MSAILQLTESKLTKLDKEAVADLEAIFTLDMVKAAIQQFPNNKMPRPHGLGVDFYKENGPSSFVF